MSVDDEIGFQVAFVVFVVSALFSPIAKNDYVSMDYWGSLAEPQLIRQYDWAGYVIDRLMEGVAKLKADIAAGVKNPVITGCVLFLQVLYLDSIDGGVFSTPHNTWPRISSFTMDLMRALVDVDRCGADGVSDSNEFGHALMRDPENVCYFWASTCNQATQANECGCHASLWDAVVRIVRVFKVPMEAAWPLFVSFAEFQMQLEPDTAAGFAQLISAAFMIIYSFQKGFRYMFTEDAAFHASVTCKHVQDCSMYMNSKSRCAGLIDGHSKRKVDELLLDGLCNQWCYGSIGGMRKLPFGSWDTAAS